MSPSESGPCWIPLRAIELERVAARHGTPYYLYDFDRIAGNARALRAAVPDRFELCYAVKANPSLGVLTLLASLGYGADTASAGELSAARAAGFPGSRLVMTGPGKSDGDLAAAVAGEIAAVHVEGLAELERLARLARAQGRKLPVCLRVNPPGAATERTPIIGGNRAEKFGFELADARAVLAARERWKSLGFLGFQAFTASNLLDADAFVANARCILALATALAREARLPLRLVDFGGGFGVPYAADEKPLDLARLKVGLSALARDASRDPVTRNARLLFEPGRLLVADAGIYVTRVLDVKRVGARRIARLDGGIHHLLRPALLRSGHPVRLFGTGRGKRAAAPVTLAGPLCTGLDLLGESVSLPEPEPGDLVAVGMAGAYGYTESMPLFLSHPWPAELARIGAAIHALRTPPAPDELLARQRVPEGLRPGAAA